jgi:tetratricopeptide (TPR) repeat protein
MRQQAQRLAVLFAGIASTETPGQPVHAAGQTSMREERALVLKAIIERGGRIVLTGDDLVVACLPDASEALGAAIAIQRSGKEARGGEAPLDIRIFVHYGEGFVTEEGLRRDLSDVVAKMADAAKPGHVYVSMETYNAQRLNAVEFKPLGESEDARVGRPFYDVVWRPETDCRPMAAAVEAARNPGGIDGPFEHASALVQGRYAPCFYCGSRKHRTTGCPSKHLPYATNGLERLGYLSMDEINRLFSDYLSHSGDDLPVLPEPASNEVQSLTYLAPWSFYELKRVFQLRFLDVVWNASSKADWHKARERRGEGFPEGGMLSYARDCIRTSRLEEAEDLLRRYGRMNGGDYRTSCGLAFVRIEKESYIAAADLLYEILERSIGNLQRTYVLLLLSRVYEFIPNLSRAHEKLRDALGVEPYCPEAMFEQIIRHFQGGREADAAKRLAKLIHIYKEYYSAARIAPELAAFRDTIAPVLQKLVAETKREAEKAVEEADREVALLKGFVGESDSDVAQVLSSHRQMVELLDRSPGLLSYHEAAAMAGRVIAACKQLDHERTIHAMTVIQRIEIRLGEALRHSGRAQQAMSLLQPILDRVLRLKEDLQARAPLALCLSQCEDMERETNAVEADLKQMDARHAMLQMWSRFSKDILLISFVTATFGLVLFPGGLSLLHSLRPDSLSLEAAEVWAGQKAILFAGTVFALIFAGFRALAERRIPHKAKSEC